MASYMDAPGAYPATPSNEEPTFQTQSNNRAEPRGLSSKDQSAHPSGHHFAGSGIYVDEPSLTHTTDAPTLSHENPTKQTSLNQTVPRSLDGGASSRNHLSGDSGVWVDDSPSSRERDSDKPAFMTAPFSRVGTEASAFTQNGNGNYTYGDEAASKPPYGDDTKLTAAPIDIARTPANTPAETTALNSINKTSIPSSGVDHNKIQSGLRGTAKTENNEPYWGDIPFGTGVYNGVTGHGSNEPSTAPERSLQDQYENTANSGVYNGITGHGSKRSISPKSTAYDEGTTSKDFSHQQRAFPLASNGHTTTTAATRSSDADEHKRDSRFKEGLADTGALAAGGYAAHKHQHNDDDGRTKGNEQKITGRRKPSSPTQPSSLKGKEQSLPHRPFVATTGQTHTQEQPLDTQDVSKHQKKDDSNLGKYGAAAGAAGAGAYGVHKYAHHDGAKEQSSVLENNAYQNTARGATQNDARPLAAVDSDTKYRQGEDSNLSKYGTAAAATAAAGAGAGAYGVNQYANRDSAKQYSSAAPESKISPSSSASAARELTQNGKEVVGDDSRTQPRYNMLSDGTPSGIASTSVHKSGDSARSDDAYASQNKTHRDVNVSSKPNRNAAVNEPRDSGSERSSSDSSRGGKYNVLSSGTPSGINLDQDRAERQRRREEHQQELREELREQKRQQPYSAAFVKPQASSAPSRAQRDAGPRDDPVSAAPGGSAQYRSTSRQAADELQRGAGAGAGAASAPGQKVTHRCTKCGEENDITQYVKG